MATTIVTGAATAVRAADFNNSVAASIAAAAINNPDLVAGGQPSDRYASLTVSEDTLIQTERAQVAFDTALTSTRYQRYSSLDTNGGSIQENSSWKSERSQWNSNIQGIADTTLTSELGRTGITSPNLRHEALSVGTGYSYSATERLSWSAQAEWTFNRYLEGRNVGLTNYDNGSLQLSPTWSISQTLQGALIFDAGLISSPKAAGESNDSASIRLSRSVTERINWQAQIGVARVNSNGQPLTSEVYSISASLQNELVRWSLSTSRSVLPIGFGFYVPTDQISLLGELGITEHSSVSGSLTVIRSASVSDKQDPQYAGALSAQLGAEWNWKLSRQWIGTMSYSQGRSRETENPWANSSQFKIDVQWRSDRL